MDPDLKRRLDERLVEGKITLEEYQQKLNVLDGPVDRSGQNANPVNPHSDTTSNSSETYLKWGLTALIIVGLLAMSWHLIHRAMTNPGELPRLFLPAIIAGVSLILGLIATGFKKLVKAAFSSSSNPTTKRKRVRRRTTM